MGQFMPGGEARVLGGLARSTIGFESRRGNPAHETWFGESGHRMPGSGVPVPRVG